MIIAQIFGGLGNQLFQYAAGKALAIHHNVELKLDILDLREYQEREFIERNYHLNNFFINAPPANEEELKEFRFANRLPCRLEKIFNKIKGSQAFRFKVYKEPFSHFDKNFFRSGKHSYLIGYWQSEKYFSKIGDILRKELRIKKEPSNEINNWIKKIRGCNSVGLHIRMGDYVQNEVVRNKLGLCSIEYYEQAIAYLQKNVEEPHFFIFSDDINWAKENLQIQGVSHFVEGNSADCAIEDFRLLSQCRHNITANSSFSWWGAWLNEYPEKIIIAPKPWFNSLGKSDDVVPQSWVTFSKN